MMDWSRLTFERRTGVPLGLRLHGAIRAAILDGRLRPGDRLPSRRDLATQLGVARGTVQAAYDRLADAGLVEMRGAAGTRVTAAPPPERPDHDDRSTSPLPGFFPTWQRPPLPFQGGVPAADAVPRKVWSRLLVRGAREDAVAAPTYPDPRGDPDLRREIAAYLGLARGLTCTPGQVFVTSGFAGALGLIILGLRLSAQRVWMEEPGFPLTRLALQHSGVVPVPVPVDEEGLIVAEGERRANNAAAAVVTAGQQAPLGMTLSAARRAALITWADRHQAWIVEDDYLGELQLGGRAAPALASLDRSGRVLHAGSFSKTISPGLRLGYLVVPPQLATRFGEIAATLAPAGAPVTQRAVTHFMAEGHFFRHLRRMKALYTERRNRLGQALRAAATGLPVTIHITGNFLIPVLFAEPWDDCGIAAEAYASGLAPVPLSPWFVEQPRRGLLVGITNYHATTLDADCRRLLSAAQIRNTDA